MRRLTRHLRDRDLAHRQAGFTLVEMIIAMFILLIVSSIATSVFVSIQRSLRKQTGYVDAQTSSRTIYEDLDKLVRYASAVSAPGTDAAGNQYVEWQSNLVTLDRAGATVNVVECYQWRVTAVGTVSQRTWDVTGGGATANPAAPAWTDVAAGVLVAGQPPVFTSPVPVTGAGTVAQKEQLGVQFVTQAGNPAGRASTNTVFTAANSTTSAYTIVAGKPVAPPICTQVARTS